MSYKEEDIIYEADNHFVIRVKDGYEVYKSEITHATRCAIIGHKGDHGLERAIKECERREQAL